MFSLLIFQPESDPQPSVEVLRAACVAEPGMLPEAPPSAPYQPLRWTCARTGAQLIIDAGTPPLAVESLGRERSLPTWRPVALHLQIPLAGPHWLCVESLACCERILKRLPGLAVLDSEDPRPADEALPGPIERAALLRSWQAQVTAQMQTRRDVFRMDQVDSLRLWRYRLERGPAQAADPACTWPEGLVLGHHGEAFSVALLPEHGPCALPPVRHLLRRHGAQVQAVAPLPGPESPHAHGVIRCPEVAALPSANPLPPLRALGDFDWVD